MRKKQVIEKSEVKGKEVERQKERLESRRIQTYFT